jgi:hypothetical protein
MEFLAEEAKEERFVVIPRREDLRGCCGVRLVERLDREEFW